jgi:hypothetical protein
MFALLSGNGIYAIDSLIVSLESSERAWLTDFDSWLFCLLMDPQVYVCSIIW